MAAAAARRSMKELLAKQQRAVEQEAAAELDQVPAELVDPAAAPVDAAPVDVDHAPRVEAADGELVDQAAAGDPAGGVGAVSAPRSTAPGKGKHPGHGRPPRHAAREQPRGQARATARGAGEQVKRPAASESVSTEVPKFRTLERKESLFRGDQLDALTALRRRLNKVRGRGEGERITDNTLIRVAVDLLLDHSGLLRGVTEDELRESVTSGLRGPGES